MARSKSHNRRWEARPPLPAALGGETLHPYVLRGQLVTSPLEDPLPCPPRVHPSFLDLSEATLATRRQLLRTLYAYGVWTQLLHLILPPGVEKRFNVIPEEHTGVKVKRAKTAPSAPQAGALSCLPGRLLPGAVGAAVGGLRPSPQPCRAGTRQEWQRDLLPAPLGTVKRKIPN